MRRADARIVSMIVPPPATFRVTSLVLTAVLTLALAGSAHALSVDIVLPDSDPAEVYPQVRIWFEAVAHDEQGNDVTDRATFTWSFPDAKEPTVGNPVLHRFPQVGKFLVSVTATIDSDSAGDETTVIVIPYEGGGLRSTPSAEDFTFTAETFEHVFDTDVCDEVALVAEQVTEDLMPFEWVVAKFYRWENGQWVLKQSGGPDGGVASYGWTSTFDPNDEGVSWRAHIELDEVAAEPPNTISFNIDDSWTPDNVVVKATGDPIILHDAEDTSHTIAWTIAHYDALDPTFTANVTICDLSGSTVTTLSDTDAEVGAGSVVWNTNLPETTGIYTYKITASHNFDPAPPHPCTDQDKSQSLVISGVGFEMVAFDPRTQVFDYWIEYTLSRAAASGSVGLKVYNRRLQQVASEVLPSGAGAQYLVDSFTCDPTITGPYHFVISATESASDGALNRDGVPKPALQKGTISPVYPRASHWRGADFAYGAYPANRLEEVRDGTRYAASIHGALPAKLDVLMSWEDDALFLLMNHSQKGGGGHVYIADAASLWAEETEDYDPDTDIALDQLQSGLYPHLYFAQLYACETALDSATYGDLCYQMRRLGADITLGFAGNPHVGDAAAIWEETFYSYSVSLLRYSVWTAAAQARDAVYEEYEDYLDSDTYVIDPWYRRDQSLWPARYGG